jgi:hypothetical protein
VIHFFEPFPLMECKCRPIQHPMDFSCFQTTSHQLCKAMYAPFYILSAEHVLGVTPPLTYFLTVEVVEDYHCSFSNRQMGLVAMKMLDSWRRTLRGGYNMYLGYLHPVDSSASAPLAYRTEPQQPKNFCRRTMLPFRISYHRVKSVSSTRFRTCFKFRLLSVHRI